MTDSEIMIGREWGKDSSPKELGNDELPSEQSKTASKTAVTGYLPPCRICGGVASGFHYGANTCEACKAFYRRCTSAGYKMKSCPTNGECTESVRGRLVCVPCRFQLCLKVGMTKGASKKGRYTHARRTEYTKEIKGESSPLKSENSSPCVSPDTVTTNQSYYSDLFEIEQSLSVINESSKESFPELNALMNCKPQLDIRVDGLIAEASLTNPGEQITEPIYSPGPGDEHILYAFYLEMKETAQNTKIAASLCDVEDSPASADSINILWKNWMNVAEHLFIQLTKYAKKLPGFEHLYLDDKVTLLKASRIEIMTLLGHPLCRPEDHLIGMYVAITQEILLTPIDMFPEGRFTRKFNEDNNKVMARLKKANYTIEDMNVVMAFILLSPDREGLLYPESVEKLQDNMLKVLEYTLKKNHPNSLHKLAETLLILPVLREHSAVVRGLLYTGREETNPELPPLISEVL